MSAWEVALVGISCTLGGIIIGFLLCAILTVAKRADEKADAIMQRHIDERV